MRISDWSSDVCSSDLGVEVEPGVAEAGAQPQRPRADAAVDCRMGGIDVPVRAAIGDCQIRLAGAPGDAEHDMFAKPCLAAHQPAVGLAVEPGSVAACVRIAPGAEPLAPEGKALAIGAAARPVAVQQRLARSEG